MVQVVQPFVCPGVRCATSVVLPSVTRSPSCKTLSIGCGLLPGCIFSSAYSDVCFEYWVRRQVFPPEERVGSPIGWLDASAWPRFFVDVLHLGWPRWFR